MNLEELRIERRKAYDMKLRTRHNGTIQRIGKYLNSNEPITHKCSACEHKWKSSPYQMLRKGKSCPKCSSYHWTESRYVKKINEVHGGKIKLLGEFKGLQYKAKHQCVTCNHKWEPYNGHVQRGHGCPKCAVQSNSKAYVKSEKQYDSELKDKHNGSIIRLDNYVNDRTKIKHQCVTCNHKWEPSPNNLLRGYGCPKCNKFGGYSKSAIEWLRYESKKRGIRIQHAENKGEYTIPGTLYRVDGYHAKTKTVFEFHGDAFHGNLKRYNRRSKPNPYSSKTALRLYKETVARELAIIALQVFNGDAKSRRTT
jgi:predicted  nucleic acid-binding Zn-ribbon protein